MLTIYKYPLEHRHEQIIEMPLGAKILTLQVQYDIPCIWALVDTSLDLIPVKITTIGTGHNIEGSIVKYVGTYQQNEGKLIWHVFKSY